MKGRRSCREGISSRRFSDIDMVYLTGYRVSPAPAGGPMLYADEVGPVQTSSTRMKALSPPIPHGDPAFWKGPRPLLAKAGERRKRGSTRVLETVKWTDAVNRFHRTHAPLQILAGRLQT